MDDIQPLSEPDFRKRRRYDSGTITFAAPFLHRLRFDPLSEPDFIAYRRRRARQENFQTYVVPAVVVSDGVLFFIDLVEESLR